MTRRMSSNTWRFLFLLFFVALAVGIGRLTAFDQQAFQARLSGLPWPASAAVFLLLYVGLTFWIWVGPKDILRIVGAVLYGPYWSTLLVWIGEMGNLLVMFSLSRRLGRGFVADRLGPKLRQADAAVTHTGSWGIFAIRFFPVVPFRFSDLGFGLTGIPLRRYFLISALASPVRVLFVQFFLAMGMDTVLNPDRLATYLEGHPVIYLCVFAYLAGALVLAGHLFGWGKRKGKG